MGHKTIYGVCIKAITAAIPSEVMGINEFSQLYGEKDVARVMHGTGIKSVRVANGLTTSAMISSAATHLLNNIGIDKNQIDGLIVITQTPDDWSPGSAFSVHHELELPTRCYVSEINSGCAGYVNGLVQAASLISSGACKNVLLCTGDINTRLIDDKDYQIRMLFGDAASATLITQGENKIDFVYGSEGGGRELLGVKLDYERNKNESGKIHYLKMDGAAVLSFALHRTPEVINTLLKGTGIKKEDVNLFALHQPNEFVLNYIRNSIDVSNDKLPSDVDGIGNTNSSSIPLLLSRYAWGRIESKRNIVLCGFGVGLAWNALLLDLSQANIIKPIEVNSEN